jgi:opacity protein-like surface antigen
VQGLQVSSSATYQKKVHVSGTASAMDWTRSEALKFSPVVGLDGTLKKWPVNANVSWNWGWKTDSSSSSKNYSETVDNSYKFGLKYEISKSGGISELKVLLWTLPIKGRLVTGAEGEIGTSVTKTGTGGSEHTESARSTTMSLTPHASYDFTDNITGQLSYTGTQKKDLSQTTTSHIFSLSVEIRFNP